MIELFYKEMSYHAMKRHGRNLNAYYEMKEANQKELHII
jgi:hypothetical protein